MQSITRGLMEKTTTATKGFAVLSAAGILNKVLSVIYIPVLLQIIGDLGYGIYSAGYRIYAFIYILTNAGFPIAVSKLQAELVARENYRDAKRSIRIISLLMIVYGLIMALLTAVFARQITYAIHYERSYLVILALAPTMLFSTISSTYRGFFNGCSYMRPTALSQIIEQLLNVVLSLGFAYVLLPYGVEAACAGATVGTTIGALGSALYLRSQYGKGLRLLAQDTPDEVKRIRTRVIIRSFLSYAIPIAINSIVINAGDLVDLWNVKTRLLSSGFLSDAADIKFGVLSKYNQLLSVPLAITVALYIAVMPSFSAAVALKDFKLLRRYVSDAFRTSFIVAVPAVVGLTVLSRPIFTLLFSQKYEDGWYLMTIGAAVILFASFVQIQSGILQALNRTRLSTISMLAGIIVKFFINYFLIAIPAINITGAVIGTIVSMIIAIYINSRYIRKYMPGQVSIRKHLGRPIMASAVMGILAGFVHWIFMMIFSFIPSQYITNAIATVIAIFIGILSYFIVMIKIGGINSEDLKAIPFMSKIKRILPSFLLKIIK